MRSLPCSLTSLTLVLVFAAAPLLALAQPQDSAPVDLASLLQELKRMREQQTTQVKAKRQAALQQVVAAAASPERAVALWEDAVRAIQFDGAPKEGTAFKEWKDKEGDGLQGKEARDAARLYFAWLALTIQRDAGATIKDLLPQVVGYTKELTTHQAMIEALDESIKRDKELNAGGKHGTQRKGNDEQVKRMNDQILNKGLAGSPVVQWLKLQDFVNPEKWENKPADFDGIFNAIILPELRLQRDARLLDYWDMRLKREAEAASKARLSFDIDKFNNQRRPSIQWGRAEDLILIGQKNRGITEMFALIKGYPQHPDLANWIARLEGILVPPLPDATVAPGLAPTPAAVPGGALPAPGVVR